MKNQKGITLIALIISIIVMLILVAVTINVALNGGIFDRAKNASTKTQKEADREELLSVVVGAYNAVEGTINETELRKLESDGWTIVKNEDDTYTCTSPKKNVFTVDRNGSISDTKSITLDKTSITLEEAGDTDTITATTIGLEGSITWESSNTGVATVTGSGKTVTVTAVADGTATITATSTVNSEKTATCEITVGGTPKLANLVLQYIVLIQSGESNDELQTSLENQMYDIYSVTPAMIEQDMSNTIGIGNSDLHCYGIYLPTTNVWLNQLYDENYEQPMELVVLEDQYISSFNNALQILDNLESNLKNKKTIEELKEMLDEEGLTTFKELMGSPAINTVTYNQSGSSNQEIHMTINGFGTYLVRGQPSVNRIIYVVEID